MTEYRIGRAIVRMHGKPNMERIKEATIRFLTEIERQEAAKNAQNAKAE
mgnify:CR=1 FL=1